MDCCSNLIKRKWMCIFLAVLLQVQIPTQACFLGTALCWETARNVHICFDPPVLIHEIPVFHHIRLSPKVLTSPWHCHLNWQFPLCHLVYSIVQRCLRKSRTWSLGRAISKFFYMVFVCDSKTWVCVIDHKSDAIVPGFLYFYPFTVSFLAVEHPDPGFYSQILYLLVNVVGCSL